MYNSDYSLKQLLVFYPRRSNAEWLAAVIHLLHIGNYVKGIVVMAEQGFEKAVLYSIRPMYFAQWKTSAFS
jgi:hypothetical protein